MLPAIPPALLCEILLSVEQVNQSCERALARKLDRIAQGPMTAFTNLEEFFLYLDSLET